MEKLKQAVRRALGRWMEKRKATGGEEIVETATEETTVAAVTSETSEYPEKKETVTLYGQSGHSAETVYPVIIPCCMCLWYKTMFGLYPQGQPWQSGGWMSDLGP